MATKSTAVVWRGLLYELCLKHKNPELAPSCTVTSNISQSTTDDTPITSFVKIKVAVQVWSAKHSAVQTTNVATQLRHNHHINGRDLYNRLSRLQIKEDPSNKVVQSSMWSSMAVYTFRCKTPWVRGGNAYIVYIFQHVMSWCLKLTTSSLRISRHQLLHTTAARTSCDLVYVSVRAFPGFHVASLLQTETAISMEDNRNQ